MRIGVLAVQGAFIEHIHAMHCLGVDCVEIRKKSDFHHIDGLILPGGESTVQGKLLRKLDLLDTIKTAIINGMPVLATCAGLILLAESIDNDSTTHLGTLPIQVKRNAYGRQLSSFCVEHPMKFVDSFPMVFIRAPYIQSVHKDMEILSTYEDKIIAVKYKNQIGLSFHPELSDDHRIHKLFLDLCIQEKI